MGELLTSRRTCMPVRHPHAAEACHLAQRGGGAVGANQRPERSLPAIQQQALPAWQPVARPARVSEWLLLGQEQAGLAVSRQACMA